MPSMLTSVAFVVCQVSVVDWPESIVCGRADSEAVGAGGADGGGGGGGATFFAHAARNMTVPSAKARVTHLPIVIVVVVAFACFTDSSSFCAPHCGGKLQIHGRAHSRPAAKPFFLFRSMRQPKSLPQGAPGNPKFPSVLYFQLQLGCVFAPFTVNCFTFVPSASMLHIWSLPERWD